MYKQLDLFLFGNSILTLNKVLKGYLTQERCEVTKV
jgi:hypothetical protein